MTRLILIGTVLHGATDMEIIIKPFSVGDGLKEVGKKKNLLRHSLKLLFSE